MNENKNVPQVEVESASTGSQRARYTAYVQCVRKLEMQARANAESRKKAERIGGAAV